MDHLLTKGKLEESLSQHTSAPNISKDDENNFHLETDITIEFFDSREGGLYCKEPGQNCKLKYNENYLSRL